MLRDFGGDGARREVDIGELANDMRREPFASLERALTGEDTAPLMLQRCLQPDQLFAIGFHDDKPPRYGVCGEPEDQNG
jgi:hypothetical protein